MSFWHFRCLPVLLAGHSPNTIISSLLLILLDPTPSFSLGISSLFSIIGNYSLVLFLQGSSQVFHLHFFLPQFMPILIYSVGDTHPSLFFLFTFPVLYNTLFQSTSSVLNNLSRGVQPSILPKLFIKFYCCCCLQTVSKIMKSKLDPSTEPQIILVDIYSFPLYHVSHLWYLS